MAKGFSTLVCCFCLFFKKRRKRKKNIKAKKDIKAIISGRKEKITNKKSLE